MTLHTQVNLPFVGGRIIILRIVKAKMRARHYYTFIPNKIIPLSLSFSRYCESNDRHRAESPGLGNLVGYNSGYWT